MFTGIIEAVGHVQDLKPMKGDVRLLIATGKLDMSDVKLGDSIAVNGVCLTVIELKQNAFWADVSAESLRCTTFNTLKVGQKVNLEKALTPMTRLGGHIVSGHVDGLGKIMEIKQAARSVFVKISAENTLAKYIAAKGSITVDGTSLTVNAVNGSEFELNIIPQTLAETVFNEYKVGQKVNLEVDLLARYLERLLDVNSSVQKEPSSITETLLKERGFI